jgi:hypothetical protein
VQEVDQGVFQEELQRLLASDTFRNSDSLRRLLAYLGEAYAAGRAREIKEYTIGRDVMGKPESYDPRVDASVRVQIGKLRQRLEHYYTVETPDSQVQVRLPKGHFELAMERKPEPSPETSVQGGDSRWKLAAGILAVVCLVLVALLLLMRQRTSALPAFALESHPEVTEFWAPFLDAKKPLTIVLGSPLFIRFHSTYYRDPAVNEWAEAQRMLPLDEYRQALKSPTPPAETRRWTPFGEAAAAFRLATILGQRKEDLVLKRSVSLAWEDVRAANLIFLGPPKFNPQLRDLPLEQDFVIESGAVRNLRPRPGESATYMKPSAPNEEDIPEDYAVITRVSGLEGWGEILVLASTSTEGTWAAADYVTEPSQLLRMLGRIREREGRIPSSYQVLVKGRFKSQVPIQTDYVTHHELTTRKKP